MPFTFDDKKALKNMNKSSSNSPPNAAIAKYEEWKRFIHEGRTPMDAAKLAGDCHFEKVGAKFSIRISGSHRVQFSIEGTHVTVLSIGGHKY